MNLFPLATYAMGRLRHFPTIHMAYWLTDFFEKHSKKINDEDKKNKFLLGLRLGLVNILFLFS